jgi:predicted nucleic acid-binding protein
VNVLVDTSAWSLAYRRSAAHLNPLEQHYRNSLAQLMADGRAELLGMVRQELLSGLREPAQFERLRKLLRAFPDVALASGDHEEAARMNNTCRSKGIAGNPVDSLICAVAARRSWPILTLDHDFDRYSKYLPIQLFGTRYE